MPKDFCSKADASWTAKAMGDAESYETCVSLARERQQIRTQASDSNAS